MPVNIDLQKERDNASFDSMEMTYFLDGGKAATERRRYIEGLVENDPELKNSPKYSMLSQEQAYSEGIRKVKVCQQRIREYNLKDPKDITVFNRNVFPNEVRPDGIHLIAFISTLEKQLSDQQKQIWLPLAKNYDIIGTYAQTELGHGTFLRGLETEATFDVATQEFIINSPTVSSTKFWPGGLGRTCNYAVVMASLKIGGKNCGMQGFIVQLRDLKTHEICKGVKLGDIGPKIGFHSIDNGYASFDHVRVPRDHMLMRYSEVTPNGEFKKSSRASEKMAYFTMIYIRARIVKEPVAMSLAQAVTIATRYSAVRRQSELKPGKGEPQVLDYQTQQHKLFPGIATAYAFEFVSGYINMLFTDVEQEILRGRFTRLPELHAMAAGLKAFSSYNAHSLLEQLRMACGGHGYSQASGLPKIYALVTPACTYEGENTILYLQTGRYLIKVYQQVEMGNGNMFKGSTVEYICNKGVEKCTSKNLTLEILLQAYKQRAYKSVERAAKCIMDQLAQGKDQTNATQASTVFITRAAEAHSHLIILQTFLHALTISPPTLKPVLTTLCHLYAVHGVTQYTGDFIRSGYLNDTQLQSMEERLISLMTDIRPDAVALVDAFDFSDRFMDSCLGRYDGNVYESLMDYANQSPLNDTEVHDTFHKYVKPIRDVLSSKL